jgi:hypothetical protein
VIASRFRGIAAIVPPLVRMSTSGDGATFLFTLPAA